MNKGFLRKSGGKMNGYKDEQSLFRKIPSTNLVLWVLCALKRKFCGCVCGIFYWKSMR